MEHVNTWVYVVGVLTLLSIAWSLGSSAVAAMRAGRFGLKHVKRTDLLLSCIALIMGAAFFYGWFSFPDAPLHPCSNQIGFCGKQGQPHTQAEYQAFELWQTTMLVLWPVGMALLFFISRKAKKIS